MSASLRRRARELKNLLKTPHIRQAVIDMTELTCRAFLRASPEEHDYLFKLARRLDLGPWLRRILESLYHHLGRNGIPLPAYIQQSVAMVNLLVIIAHFANDFLYYEISVEATTTGFGLRLLEVQLLSDKVQDLLGIMADAGEGAPCAMFRKRRTVSYAVPEPKEGNMFVVMKRLQRHFCTFCSQLLRPVRRTPRSTKKIRKPPPRYS
jgi:hypothetical protein